MKDSVKKQSGTLYQKKKIRIIKRTDAKGVEQVIYTKQIANTVPLKLEVRKCLLSGRPEVWIVKRGNTQIRKIQILPFNSLLIKRYEEEGKDIFIHSNLFANIFDRDTPYSQTQYHIGKVQKNKVHQEIPKQEQTIHPLHQKVSVNQFLRQFYMMYLQMETSSNNNESSQTIFYYDTTVTKLPLILTKRFGWFKHYKQQFLEQHEDYDYIAIFGIPKGAENREERIQSELIIYSAQNKGQPFSFRVGQVSKLGNSMNEISKYDIQYKQISVTQNELIVLFHKILFDKGQKENLDHIRSLEQSISQMRKYKSFNSQIQSLKRWSFTRQFNYSKFYSGQLAKSQKEEKLGEN